MLIKKVINYFLIIYLCLLTSFAFSAKPVPPKNTLVASQQFENIVDNAWTNLEFPKNIQPKGLYYVELTQLVGTVGCWGSKKDPYPNGENGEILTAWRDGVPLEDGKADFRLQYRPAKSGTWVELIVIAPQAAIMDTWFPFGLQEAKESIGQTFIAPQEFSGVGLSTPTWVTKNSGCVMSLYSATGEKFSVEPKNKIAIQWGILKL